MTARYYKNLLLRFRLDLALVLICCAVFAPKVIREYKPEGLWFGDNPYYMLTTQSMVKDGDLDLRNQLGKDTERLRDSTGLGTGGEWYSTHPVLMSVAAVPFYIFFGNAGFLVFNVMVMTGIVLLMFRVALLYAPPWAAFAAAVLFAFTTQVYGMIYNFSPDAFSTLVTLAGVILLLKERPLAGGVFWGLAFLSRTTNLIPYLMAFPLLFLGEGRVRSTIKFLVGSVPFMGLFLVMNKIQYGGFFTLSYDRVIMLMEDGAVMMGSIRNHFGLEYVAGGLWGQLADRDHGLLFTNAVSLVGLIGLYPLFRRSRRGALYIVLTAASIYVFHAFFKLWYISTEGTNRYLFTTIVLMAVPFAVLLDRIFEKK